ncbi:zinc-ribbon domain-containing protein, partial [Psychrobacter sp. 1U2]
MTTLIKTQCPSCQAYFSLPQTLLNELDAKVRCKRCQQIFLVNENLVVSGNEPSGINNTSTFNQKNNHNNVQQKDDDFLSSDTLIYDDMPIDYLESPNSAHNSLDEMSAWSFDLDAT